MDHRFDFVLGQGAFNRAPIPQIAHDERPPSHRIAMPARQVIEGDGLRPHLSQRFAAMRADIARTACDQDPLPPSHIAYLSSSRAPCILVSSPRK